MATKSILLAVADPQILIDVTQALGTDWEAISVASEAEALEQLGQRSFDALLADFNLGSSDASELINQAVEKRPETTRFLLAYEADLALIAATVNGSHQILPKPVEAASLKSRIESAIVGSDANQTEAESTTETGQSQAIPAVYAEVLKALESSEATSEQVGQIIGGDTVLTTEVLRLAQSDYMGLPSNVTDPAEAVESLGLETVKAIVMALRFLAEHSQLKSGYLSLSQLWQHNTNVAQLARDLVLFETKDRTLASQAFAAGLLHDLGKVVLAANFDDLYGRVHSLARKQPVPLWEIEKEMFGANHGEIGACLLGMWNMPICIVDAAALHHEPPLGEHEELTPLAAVHIANVLEHQLRPNDEFRVAPIISAPFLNELGLLQRLPVWRAKFANRGSAKQLSEVEPIETDQEELVTQARESSLSSRTANHLQGPATATRTTTTGQASEDHGESVPAKFWQKRWMYGAVAAGVLLLLSLWLRTQSQVDESAAVYARTPARQYARAAEPSTPSPETIPATAPQDTPAATVPEPTVTASVAKPETPQPAPEPIAAIASEAAVTNVPPPSLPTQESVVPDFRLNGIIYTVARPSAILNGKIVYVGDQVGGATVVSIGRAEVTLKINGVRRSYALP